MSSHLDYEINKELGECYLFMGDLEKAEEYYQKAVGSNGVHPDPYLGLATIAVQRGELDNALALYRKASSIEPNDKSLTGMALVEMEIGSNSEAFEHFEGALIHNPENLVAIFGIIQLGYITEQVEQVIPYLQTTLEVNPLKDDVRFSLAGCLATIGKKDEALKELDEVLSRDPQNKPALELYEQISLS